MVSYSSIAAHQQRINASRSAAAIKRAKEVCHQGHKNWGIRKDGTRYCRTCNNDRNYRRRH
jgi:hypothetical protein